MFELTETLLDPEQLKSRLTDPRAGACVTFEGWVRNHNEGRQVISLEYEAFTELAKIEATRILEEAKDRFSLLQVYAVHRTGTLAIGDMAVWVGVSAPHRKEAFDGCRYIIDEIKHRLPIWKKETYIEGDSGWVNCEHCVNTQGHSHVSITPELYYSRQEQLPDMSKSGSERLRGSKVLVVGAGGLGSPVLVALAQAGVGTLGICDFDVVAVSNLHRQCLYTVEQVGLPKVTAAQETLSSINPFIQLHLHEMHLAPDNAANLFRQYDLVLGCTDNFDTQFLLSDMALLTGTPVIQASVYQYEGWLHGIFPREQEACLRCLWPIQPMPGCTGVCSDVGTLGAVVNTLGSLQAMEALKFLLNMPRSLTSDTLLLVDLLSMSIQTIRQPGNDACPLCRQHSDLKSVDKFHSVLRDESIEINVEQLSNGILIDIRELHERHRPIPDGCNVLWMPLSQFSPDALEPQKSYILCCSHGVRSRYLARQLRGQGIDAYSLRGGLLALDNGSTVSC